MLAAAHTVDPTFRIMLSPDFDESPGATPDSVVTAVMRVKNDPSIYRMKDGRIVLAPFFPERQPLAFWTSLRDKLAAQGVQTALVPIFLDWKPDLQRDSLVAGYSTWGSRWVSATPEYVQNAGRAHNAGKLWMSPVAFEDVRPKENRFWEPSNSGELRSSFERAIEGNAEWVSLTTWNDYTESWMAPSQERGYAVGDVSAYYISWLKTGTPPTILRDGMYYFHRQQLTTAPYDRTKQTNGPMTVPYGDPATNNVELLAFLTAPGTLTITQGKTVKILQAPTGVTSFRVPMVAGTTPTFRLTRNRNVVADFQSATAIRTSMTYQDMMNHSGSSMSCPR